MKKWVLKFKRSVKPSVISSVITLGIFGVMFGAIGCASKHQSSNKIETAKTLRLERRLRQARFKIEMLREQNWALKSRVKIAAANAGEKGVGQGQDPQLSREPLAAFKPGMQLDVQISPSRQIASLVSRSGPFNRNSKNRLLKLKSEQADSVLARKVVELLKSGDSAEAERTTQLLVKSYPDSELVAEAWFQQGLHFFRKKNLPTADRLFLATINSPNAHLRARAGAVLMRGIIAKRLASDGTISGRSPTIIRSNYELSRKTFEYVRKAFPGSPEALRANRELARMK